MRVDKRNHPFAPGLPPEHSGEINFPFRISQRKLLHKSVVFVRFKYLCSNLYCQIQRRTGRPSIEFRRAFQTVGLAERSRLVRSCDANPRSCQQLCAGYSNHPSGHTRVMDSGLVGFAQRVFIHHIHRGLSPSAKRSR